MRSKTSNRFDNLKQKALGNSDLVEPDKAPKRPTVLSKRQDAVVAAASGKVRTVKIFSHDPKRIRAWAGHNRDYDALSKERCADLIEGFRRADQQFAAIVRTVQNSEDFDYEFICGARRHWTANYLQRDLLIEVRNIDDRAAFLLQDIENRDREDISDYERACDYAKALPVYFEGKKSHMAEQLQIDSGNFNRLLALVDLPRDIVDAYADIRELVVHHGNLYTKFLKESDAKKRVLVAAKKLKGQGASGKEVMSALRQAAIGKVTSDAAPTQNSTRRGTLTVKQGRAGQITVSFTVPHQNREEGLAAIQRDFQNMIDSLDEPPSTSRPKSAVAELES
jgi:ParB family chromosome partitioning protein